jgi:pimeloyl-[acyl-carrier protein] methyl ester esterase
MTSPATRPAHWLLLRGLAREQRHWGRFPSLLATSLEGAGGAQVHCLDLPGTGTEHLRKSPMSIAGITEDLRKRWLELRAQNPGSWGLFAMSLGGMVAMDWTARHGDDFAAAVLVNTSAANLAMPWRRMRINVLPDILKALVSRDELQRNKRILKATAKLLVDPEPLAREWVAIQAHSPIARTTVLRQLFAASRFRAPESLPTPVLVIAGAQDPLCDPECPRRLALRFSAPLVVHPRAGHDLSIDDPEWLAAQVRAFLDSRAPASSAA